MKAFLHSRSRCALLAFVVAGSGAAWTASAAISEYVFVGVLRGEIPPAAGSALEVNAEIQGVLQLDTTSTRPSQADDGLDEALAQLELLIGGRVSLKAQGTVSSDNRSARFAGLPMQATFARDRITSSAPRSFPSVLTVSDRSRGGSALDLSLARIELSFDPVRLNQLEAGEIVAERLLLGDLHFTGDGTGSLPPVSLQLEVTRIGRPKESLWNSREWRSWQMHIARAYDVEDGFGSGSPFGLFDADRPSGGDLTIILIPEPQSWALIAGFLSLGLVARRRR